MTLKEAIEILDASLVHYEVGEAWNEVKSHLPKPTKYKRPELNLEWDECPVGVAEVCEGRVVFVDYRGAWYFTKIPSGARLATVAENFKRYVHTAQTIQIEEYRNGRLISTKTY